MIAVVSVALGVPIIQALTGAIGPQAVTLGLQGSAKAPRLPKNAIPKILATAADLRARGLVPQVGTNPYTGNVFIGTKDQNLDLLLREAAIRKINQPTAADLREIEGLAAILRRNPQEVGPLSAEFPTIRALQSQAVVAQLPVAAAASVTAKLAGPGTVIRPSSPGATRGVAPRASSARLGGPCAGRSSSLQRIRCSLGEFA